MAPLRNLSLGVFAICSLAAATPRLALAQHITVDGRFSSAQTLIGPNYAIDAKLGRQVGSNLFHSFGQFNLVNSPVRETATFTSTGSTGPISNVIGRVTGGAQSSINGTIASTITGANLYLINPNGIVFGSNATVNVSGSFHASTADYLRMSDGARFQATNPDASTLSAAPPAAFGFLTVTPRNIMVNGSTLAPGPTPSGAAPANLGLVAGPVAITGGTLRAPAGTIQVTSAAGSGEVPVDPRNTASLTVTSFGPVAIKGGSTLDVSSGGSVFVRSGALTIDASEINADNYGSGPGGVLSLRGDNQITLSNDANVHALAMSTGTGADVLLSTASPGIISIDNSAVAGGSGASGIGGMVSVTGGVLSVVNLGSITSEADAAGEGGPINISAGAIRIDGSAAQILPTGIISLALGSGKAGDVAVSAQTLSVLTNGAIGSVSFGSGNSGSVSVKVADALSIDGINANPNLFIGTGISSLAFGNNGIGNSGGGGQVQVEAASLAIANGGGISTSTLFAPPGNAGNVTVHTGTLSITNNAVISSGTSGSGNVGTISVNVDGQFLIDGSDSSRTGIFSDARRFRDPLTGRGGLLPPGGIPGNIRVITGALTIVNGGVISASTSGPSSGGDVAVSVAGALSIDGIGSNPAFQTGIVSQANTGSMGNGGRVVVSSGSLSILNNGEISSNTFASGSGGRVFVSAGAASIANNGAIEAGTLSHGNGGMVSINVAEQLVIDGTSQSPTSVTGITSQAFPGSTGNAGSVMVTAGILSIGSGGEISGRTFGPGNGGSVLVTAEGPLTLNNPGSGIVASATASGNAGSVTVTAGQITLASGGEIASTTAGKGMGGSVSVTTPGALVLDGQGIARTQIAASATGPQSGPGGSLMIAAGSLTAAGGAQIASTTAGPGKGGDIALTVADEVTLSGSGPSSASGISAAALPGSSGAAGEVVLTAGRAIALSGGAQIASSTFGAGHGGSVQVTAGGLLSLTDPGSGILTSANSLASGNAGSAIVAAPQITIVRGGEIVSTTAGTGAGGSVTLTTPGALVLDGQGIVGTQIAASATGPQSGPGGSVMIAAGSLTAAGGAQIASSTAGPGKGGDVNIAVASEIVLPDQGPQITALSIGSGDAGSITLSAARLLMKNGAAVSTEAFTSAANGGNITLHLRDFLYLISSEITASVRGETGNGGDILIDPQLVILDHSAIIADAIRGHGGNITISADELIVSSDSRVRATGELSLNGLVNANGALAVLSTQLRSRTEVLRETCAARTDRPLSTLAEAGRGGRLQDPEATLPALYIAGRDLDPNPLPGGKSTEASIPIHTTVRLAMRCG